MKKKRGAKSDLYAEVNQSACDKLLDSVKYPFTVLEKREDFPGCPNLVVAEVGAFHRYTKKEMQILLSDAVEKEKNRTLIDDQVYSFGGSIIEQTKRVLDAANGPKPVGVTYEGPETKELEAIIEGGITELYHTLGDWGIYGWCSYLRVILEKRPQIYLASPRIDLKNVIVNVTATGELWAKYPWYNCYQWCLKWKKVIKCDRIASATASLDIKADAHVNCQASGALVSLQAVFDSLRLNYPVLDKIPLEGFANKELQDKLVYVYDASQLVESVPVLRSRFTVDSISLPPNPNGISVGVVVRQV
jgi:hypothetical protein